MSDFVIRPFRAQDAPAFAALNRRWIEELFSVETTDLNQLENPQVAVLDQGGFIAVAESDGWVLGTGGILPAKHPPADGRKWLEIIKMATEPSAQGKGIGKAVLNRLLQFAEEQQAEGIWLETSSKLEAAISLYRRMGFTQLSDGDLWGTPYSRCNLQMVKRIERPA